MVDPAPHGLSVPLSRRCLGVPARAPDADPSTGGAGPAPPLEGDRRCLRPGPHGCDRGSGARACAPAWPMPLSPREEGVRGPLRSRSRHQGLRGRPIPRPRCPPTSRLAPRRRSRPRRLDRAPSAGAPDPRAADLDHRRALSCRTRASNAVRSGLIATSSGHARSWRARDRVSAARQARRVTSPLFTSNQAPRRASGTSSATAAVRRTCGASATRAARRRRREVSSSAKASPRS